MARTHGQRRPTFIWQGFLILVPAAALAAFGFYSLRQDGIIAEHQLRERAGEIAEQVAAQFERLLTIEAPPVEQLSLASMPSVSIESEWVHRASDRGRGAVVWVEDSSGGIVNPGPVLGMPLPQPLDPAAMTPEQRSAWTTFEQVTPLATSVEMASTLLERSRRAELPDRFFLIGWQRLAALAEQLGDIERAESYWRSIVEHPSEYHGESGFPLRIFAMLKLIELSVHGDRKEVLALLDRAAAWAVLHENPLTAPTLERVEAWAETGGNADTLARVELWRSILEARRRAREIAEQVWRTMEAEGWGAGDWIEFGDSEFWLSTSAAANGFRVYGAWPMEALEQMSRQSIAAVPSPAYLGVSVELAGRSIGDSSEGAELAAWPASMEERSVVAASVRLADSNAFYAEQRTRMLRFGGLVAAATGVMVFGFLSAWRAFHRQRELSEMRSNFVSSVSHEIRAPIASIRLMAEELEEVGLHDRQRAKQYHRFIAQECRRLSGLVENVLDFSRSEQGRKEFEMELTDLKELIHATIETMQPYATDKGVLLKVTLPEDDLAVEADGRAVQQAMVNLIDNAIKHSPAGSDVEIGGRMENDGVVLWVRDHGDGIPKEEQERIFERFYRRGSELRRETQGIGLGLTIVRMITEAHAGQIKVESEPGRGACFSVQLPALQRKSDQNE